MVLHLERCNYAYPRRGQPGSSNRPHPPQPVTVKPVPPVGPPPPHRLLEVPPGFTPVVSRIPKTPIDTAVRSGEGSMLPNDITADPPGSTQSRPTAKTPVPRLLPSAKWHPNKENASFKEQKALAARVEAEASSEPGPDPNASGSGTKVMQPTRDDKAGSKGGKEDDSEQEERKQRKQSKKRKASPPVERRRTSRRSRSPSPGRRKSLSRPRDRVRQSYKPVYDNDVRHRSNNVSSGSNGNSEGKANNDNGTTDQVNALDTREKSTTPDWTEDPGANSWLGRRNGGKVSSAHESSC